MINKISFLALLFVGQLLALGAATRPAWQISLGSACRGLAGLFGRPGHRGHQERRPPRPGQERQGVVEANAAGRLPGGSGGGRRQRHLCRLRRGHLVLRFTSAGKRVWQADLDWRCWPPPCCLLMPCTRPAATGRVSKVRKKDGALMKKVELGLPVHSSPVWDAGRRVLLVPTKDYFLFALDRSSTCSGNTRQPGSSSRSRPSRRGTRCISPPWTTTSTSWTRAAALLWKFKARGWVKASPGHRREGTRLFRQL